MRLAEVLPADVHVCIVADGFGDHKLYRVLTEELKFDFVIRIRGAAALGTWLCDHAVAQSRDHDRLVAALEARCRTLQIEPPTPDRIERIARRGSSSS